MNKWVSDMTPGSHHMIFFTRRYRQHADGIDMSNNCGVGGGSTTNHAEVDVRVADARTSKKICPPMTAPASRSRRYPAEHASAAFQMHYLNATDNPLTAHVTLSAYELADARRVHAHRRVHHVPYQTSSIPPGATGVKVPGSCPMPAGAKFWTVSTHAHKQAVETEVMDGSTMIFDSTDWEHPGSKNWMRRPVLLVHRQS